MKGNKKLNLLLAATAFGLVFAQAAQAQAPASSPTVRLYALDCGRHVTTDLGRLSDTFERAGEEGEKVSPCWLVRHAKGNLMWDLGWGDKYAAAGAAGTPLGPLLRIYVNTTAESQLKELGLVPADIDFVALSHLHLDHSGNAPLFAGATWIVNRRELAWAGGELVPSFIDQSLVKLVGGAKKIVFDLDHDVFGDGSVRILRAPGHTPGSAALMVQLPRSGNLIISGDLYHSREAFENSLVPGSNDSRADTLASMDRIKRLMRNFKARLVVHHAPEDFRAMPRFPAYLE